MTADIRPVLNGTAEDTISSSELNQVEGVTEIESLCMNCHDNVSSSSPLYYPKLNQISGRHEDSYHPHPILQTSPARIVFLRPLRL